MVHYAIYDWPYWNDRIKDFGNWPYWNDRIKDFGKLNERMRA